MASTYGSMNRLSACIRSTLAALVLVTAVSRAEPRDHEAVEALLNSKDPFVERTVIPNIEKHRKSDFTLRLVDAQGRAVPFSAVVCTCTSSRGSHGKQQQRSDRWLPTYVRKRIRQ
jgi:hypothetical protein